MMIRLRLGYSVSNLLLGTLLGLLLLGTPGLVRAAVPAGNAGVLLPDGTRLQTVDFERHIMGLFGKTGCNLGSCHGSFQGKNGFRLSLFGYEPEKDFLALTREQYGRRLDGQSPDHSLLLLKATGRVLHEGGMRFGANSWQYQVFRTWIEQGAKWNRGSGEVVSLKITPAEFAMLPPEKSLQIKVQATFADGVTEDVTSFCDFRISDDAIATATPQGTITAVRPGDTGLAIIYRGQVQAIRVLVPMPAKPGFVYPKLAATNFIDREVFAKLRKLNMLPSDLSTDEEFLRRVTIDTIGTLPTPEELRAFVADKRSDKRDRKIAELLQHPLHAALWATKFSDITGNNTDLLPNPANLRFKRSQMWHDWLRKRIADNVPYDQIVEQIVTATSRDGLSPDEWIKQVDTIDSQMTKDFDTDYSKRKSLDLFWLRAANVPIEQWGEKVAVAFLGVRLECAQCHKHPTDRWTQADYRSFANLFATVATTGTSPETKQLIAKLNEERKAKAERNNQVNLVREVFLSPTAPRNLFTHPDTNAVLAPKALGGPEIPHVKGEDTRVKLFQWMRAPKNPLFARSFVNRVWAHYMGIGLIDPVDDFSLANPPSNARLLDALAQSFIESGYNIRKLEQQILQSRTYQLTATPNDTNRFDRNNYSHAMIRPMMAEVVVDVINAAIGVEDTFGAEVPKGKHMIEIGASRVNNPNLTYALRIFGRPPRTAACDCERAMDPALPQTLYRMTDQSILTKLAARNNRIDQLIAKKLSDAEILDELFLAALSRKPTAAEREAFADHREREADRRTAFVDTLWALLNTREFILNH
ncbi:DUF1549 domain-containing protein [Tuwongella immobilis]|uniref:BIG2 domain-containing protein n=1 Tax=Tuwongella immobilis TaxID=692036 RepID=A0A6C2YII9_9BACT|nr:DUF1549 domain-containing protein [Tuwongella immobilis]VIP01358.1 Uncharacterized protein OS=Pirellula staleyi (strain ATCC 27377 / DSM 6068 / ICPB 4128) GN=Psta_4283 PE=4 SV=1: PSCyt2: PSD1 [Tuwongella immobilis]VTR98167.1 Uncharacterized protein OS=Pirellula staleyi (strain ATCC 27377 / DSM 6068 / ICPB 4128) GN=Psta_4283 PE=4 SV=1: PSCyt2: PSD1 [Tuwongella immobilis]